MGATSRFFTGPASPLGLPAAGEWPLPAGTLAAVIVFEVHLTSGSDGEGLLSAEVLAETNAQVMTPAEAKAVGFDGFPEAGDLRLVAVADTHERWIEKALERAHQVTGYRAHRVDA